MRVFSPSNEYTVLARLRDGRRFTAHDREGRSCLIVVEKRTGEARRLTPILQKWLHTKEFSDFHEFFPYKGGIAAVFACHEGGEPLDCALLDMPYRQRADLLRGIFSLILRESLPPELLRGVMYPENLRAYPSGKAELLYDLPRVGASALRYTVRCVCGGCSAPEIDRLYAMTEDASTSDLAKLYEAAGRAADKLAEYTPPPEPDRLTLNGVKERAIAVKSAFFGRAAVMLVLAAILAGYIAVGVLFYRTVIAPPRVDNGIRAIGTVVIDDGA